MASENGRKKVIQFIGSLNYGGAETLVKNYVCKLNPEKFEMIIMVMKSSCETSKVLLGHDIKIIEVVPKWNIMSLVANKLGLTWICANRIRRIINKEQPDILHIHLELLRYIAPIRKYLKGMSLFYTCHSIPKRFFSGKNAIEFMAAKKLIQENQLRLIALHKSMAEELNTMFSIKNTAVLRNGIDFERFINVKEKKGVIRNKLNIPLNSFVVGHIGRFEEAKNHNLLIDIFMELCQRKDDVYLLMVGTGALKQQIEEKLNHFGLAGKYQILSHREDIPELLRAMDVFVFPSTYEGFGMVLIEAQVSGLHCVVSDSIPKEVFLTPLITGVSINASLTCWCDEIVSTVQPVSVSEELKRYDMNLVIRDLEKLYLNE